MKKKKDKYNLIIRILIISICIVLILFGVFTYNDYKKNNSYTIKLRGFDTINLYVGDSYVEYGYDVYDNSGNLVIKDVTRKGNVDINKIGEYILEYSIDGRNITKRTINVLENPITNATFNLIDNAIIEVNLKNPYQDYGFTCLTKDGDCSSNVKVESDVDTNKIGSYTVKYTLSLGKKTKELVRVVNVVGEPFSYELSDTNLTNQDVSIVFYSNIKNTDFDHILLPNGDISNYEALNYLVNKNGDYKFVIYKKDNTTIESVIKISNIDKTSPSGSCSGTISGNRSVINIQASDSSGILKYSFNGKDYTSPQIIVEGIVSTSNIVIYDNANNTTNISCSVTYPQIVHNEGETVAEFNSSSLKYRIIKDGSYRTAFIWAEDPYNQLKVGLGGNPNGLRRVPDIMATEVPAITAKGYVAVNASFFTSNSFEPFYQKDNSNWIDTSTVPYLLNGGKVIRDFTNGHITSLHTTCGFTKNNEIKIYNFRAGDSVAHNATIKAELSADGVKYTFAPSGFIVINGAVSVGNDGVSAGRSAFCQINKNNYILFNTTGGNTLYDVANYLKGKGCISAVNLDGGGSRQMSYQNGLNSYDNVTYSDRKVADALYFVEK